MKLIKSQASLGGNVSCRSKNGTRYETFLAGYSRYHRLLYFK